MFICLCHGVSDKKIRALIQSGAGDVKTIRAACNAGGDCGKCIFDLKKMISECENDMPNGSRKVGT